jgi:hypothetical protein
MRKDTKAYPAGHSEKLLNCFTGMPLLMTCKDHLRKLLITKVMKGQHKGEKKQCDIQQTMQENEIQQGQRGL